MSAPVLTPVTSLNSGRLRPSGQETGAECAVVASAGDGEVVRRGERAVEALRLPVCLLELPGFDEVLFELREVARVAGEVSDPVVEAGHHGLRLEAEGHGLAPLRGGAGREACC